MATNGGASGPGGAGVSILEKEKEKLVVGWGIVLAIAAAAASAAAADPLANHLELPWASTKPFPTWSSFYPFYLTQHQDVMCRRLHVVGSTIVVLMVALDVHLGLSLALASCVGVTCFSLTRSMETGVVEMAVVIFTLLASYRRLTKSLTKPLVMLAVGYGFAWCGHFFFELNRPATFIYPTLSLAGDLSLWKETVTGERPW